MSRIFVFQDRTDLDTIFGNVNRLDINSPFSQAVCQEIYEGCAGEYGSNTGYSIVLDDIHHVALNMCADICKFVEALNARVP